MCSGVCYAVIPNFLPTGAGFMEDSFSIDKGGGGFRIIQEHDIYCALYFYCYYISSYLRWLGINPRDWGPCVTTLFETAEKREMMEIPP